MSELDTLRDEVRALRAQMDAADQARLRSWRLFRHVLAASSALLISLGGVAWAATGGCPNAMPFCFAANAPAKAAEVNQNFMQLKEWIEQKVGPTGSTNVAVTGATNVQALGASSVTASTVTASNLITTSNLTINGDVSAPNNTSYNSGYYNVYPLTCPNEANGRPTTMECPDGSYICGIISLRSDCGTNWYDSGIQVHCCGL